MYSDIVRFAPTNTGTKQFRPLATAAEICRVEPEHEMISWQASGSDLVSLGVAEVCYQRSSSTLMFQGDEALSSSFQWKIRLEKTCLLSAIQTSCVHSVTLGYRTEPTYSMLITSWLCPRFLLLFSLSHSSIQGCDWD